MASDKDIQIGIRTTGTQEAAASIRKVDEQVERLGKDAPKAAAGINKVSGESAKLGKGGNAGMAALEFSRAFEDAQYGIRGVLNNLPVLVAALGGSAGLAGVISIAAVAGTQLWERMQGGTKSAKDEVDEYKAALEKVQEAYKKQFDQEEDQREDQLKRMAQTQREAISGARSGASLAGMKADLEFAQTKAATQIELARERVRLAELEQKSATSTGEEAIRWANERLAVVQRIAEVERRSREEARQHAIEQAQIKKAEADQRMDAAKATADRTYDARQAVQGQLAGMSSERAEIAGGRMEMVQYYSQQIAELTGELRRLIDNPPSFGGEAADAAWRQQQADITAKIGAAEREREAELQQTKRETDLSIGITELTGKLKKLNEEVDAAAEAQRDAIREQMSALQSLRYIRETQGVESATERTIGNISSGGANDPGIQQAGRNITDAVLQAIGMIQGNARVSGREMTPGESEAISQASQLLADTTPDSQQGAQLMAILQKLAGNLTEKDASLIGGLNQIINIVGTQTDAILKIQERIGALAAKVAQVGKITDEAMKVAQEAKSKAEAAEAQSKFATAESIKAAGQKAAAAAADSALAVAITKQLR